MAIDSSLIGKSSSPQTFEVTREAVQRFMEATEDPALHSDTPVEYAPPTFPTTFRMRVPGLELDTHHGDKRQRQRAAADLYGAKHYDCARQIG